MGRYIRLREIDSKVITEQVNKLCIEGNIYLGEDVIKSFKENLQKEEKLSSLQADFLRRLVAINIPSLNNKANDLVIKLSNEDFANLEKDINATFDQFTVRLKKEYPLLDKNEIQFCCLIKIQLDLNTLANIYCRSKAAISKRKLRIKQEKLNITDKNISLDDFIQRF